MDQVLLMALQTTVENPENQTFLDLVRMDRFSNFLGLSAVEPKSGD
jgi:hypothetical protein